MNASRRTFMQQSLAAALLANASAANAQQGVTHDTAPKLWLEGSDLVAKMEWFNPPASVTFDTGAIIAKSRPKTDFWRKTFYGYVTNNGHFFRIPVFGEFAFQARVNGKYASLYDQAGLMVRLDDARWMKCGSEFVEGKRWASVVFTHDFSDWSTTEDLSQSEGTAYLAKPFNLPTLARLVRQSLDIPQVRR